MGLSMPASSAKTTRGPNGRKPLTWRELRNTMATCPNPCPRPGALTSRYPWKMFFPPKTDGVCVLLLLLESLHVLLYKQGSF